MTRRERYAVVFGAASVLLVVSVVMGYWLAAVLALLPLAMATVYLGKRA